MEGINPNVFRAYDIRGLWGQDFNAEFAQRLAARVSEYLKGGTLVVGRDGRASSEELSYALVDGAVHTGARVIDIGHVSTPQLTWSIKELRAVGGLMATASHNPGEYNGIKVIAYNGQSLDLIGGHELRQIYDSHNQTHRTNGVVDKHDIIPAYAYAVAAAAGWHGQALAATIDAPPPVRRALEVITTIAPHEDLAAKFDADADRIKFFSDGKALSAEWIFLLLAEHLKLEPVVFDLRFSRTVAERLMAHKVLFKISAVGRLAMTQNMKSFNAAFGGEISGHYYWKTFSDMESPELVLLNVARIVEKSRTSLAELVASYVKYFKSDEVSLSIKDHKAAIRALERVAAAYAGSRVSRLDGISIDRWADQGWWLNIRASNTEPMLRLVVEAKEKDLLESKLKEVQGMLGR